MQQLIQIGKPSPATNISDFFKQLAQREAEEIRRLKQALVEQYEH